jgi:hypothetical protein
MSIPDQLRSELHELILSDRKTGGRHVLLPDSRARLREALEQALVDWRALHEHIRLLQEQLGKDFRHTEPLADEVTEHVLAERLDVLTDADLAALALNPVALYALHQELYERLPESWWPQIHRHGRELQKCAHRNPGTEPAALPGRHAPRKSGRTGLQESSPSADPPLFVLSPREESPVTAPAFLTGVPLRPVRLPDSSPYEPIGLALGNGASALEVLVTTAKTPPRLPNVRSLWRERNNRRAAPLLVVVLHDGKATLCGPAGEDPPAYPGLDPGQTERICREALEQPDRHAALRFLRDALPAVAESRLPGVRNEGFLATHELTVGARRLDAWEPAAAKARRVLDRRGEALLRGLGFKIEPHNQVTSVLRAGANGTRVAVAVLLHQAEAPDLEADRFSGLSPVSYAMAVADQENLPYVVLVQGTRLRLYPVKINVGVGRRGRTETYLEVHTGLLPDRDAAYLWLLFSGEALAEGGTLDILLAESRRFAHDLAERLRDRVYGEVVPGLARGLAQARGLKKPTARDLAETYEMAMTVLFRLLFIAYAEDKDLLPYRWNGLYRSRSLKTKAQELLELHDQGTPFDQGDSLWEECRRLFRAVAEGNREWGVPEYDGGLFSSSPEVSRVGKLLDEVTLPNTVLGPALRELLTIHTDGEPGPVDFRSLSVREFGTIYEGLLESELSVAQTDLTVDERGYYRPCRAGEEPLVNKSRIYLHNRSGARKASGTYFTKEFAVDHLLDHALEPALGDHLGRLDRLDVDVAAERFFDFRVADIAMGSGHFLVAAVDRIERAFTQYLAHRSLPGVRHELACLRASAQEALGNLADQLEIEDTQLLRRLIARRCIYGVDLNPVAVNLARLSIWIHTFVPGLPLSLLDHNLVPGNSLVGIARLAEIEEKIKDDGRDPEDKGQRCFVESLWGVGRSNPG